MGQVQTSTDGIHWTLDPAPTGSRLMSILIKGDSVLVVGENTLIMNSPVSTPAIIPIPIPTSADASDAESAHALALRVMPGQLILAMEHSSPDGLRAAIYDLRGNRLAESSPRNSVAEWTIPLRGIQPGRYVVKVAGAGLRATRTFAILP
jgi:hypothetical protein